jgi:hypothetical protein
LGENGFPCVLLQGGRRRGGFVVLGG